jgi:hypothetical protein
MYVDIYDVEDPILLVTCRFTEAATATNEQQ